MSNFRLPWIAEPDGACDSRGGDALLFEVAKRLSTSVRRDDFVSRLAGDEFIVLCPGINTAHEAQRVAEALCQTLSQPYRIGNREIRMSASVGVALATKHDSTLDELLAKADAAMYRAKKTGKDKYFISACRL